MNISLLFFMLFLATCIILVWKVGCFVGKWKERDASFQRMQSDIYALKSENQVIKGEMSSMRSQISNLSNLRCEEKIRANEGGRKGIDSFRH